MDIEFINFFKTNFQTDIPNDHLKNLVKEKDSINENNEYLLLIRKILWNEIALAETERSNKIIFDTLCLWKMDKIDYTDLKVMIHLLFNEKLISVEDIYDICDILIGQSNHNDMSEWLNGISRKFEELISVIPNLSVAIQVYSKIYGQEIDQKWEELASKSKSLIDRPEYAIELLKITDIEDLAKLIYWVDPANRQKIIDFEIEEFLSEGTIVKELESIDIQNSEFPRSFNVLGSKIQELDQTVLDSKEFENIPQNHLNSWLPKFVYSKPDVKQKIKIFFPGGRDIGHSGILIKTNEGILLFDFGLSVVNNTFPSWHPLLEKIDAVFLSHAHLDHSGGLPLLMRDGRSVPWFGTKETGILAEMLWNDTVKISGRLSDHYLESSSLGHISKESNVLNAMNNFNSIDVGETIKVLPKVEITTHNASHLFGSVGFEINVDGTKLFYTGDFNLDNMKNRNTQFPSDIDQLIFDGTYYNRPSTFTPPEETLKHVLDNSKRIIIPAFSMGRSQEMLFQLRNLKADKNWKIVLTGMGGRLAKKLKMGVGPSGGGKKAGVVIANTLENEDFIENTIVIAGQGMFQAGTSRRLLEHSKGDDETSIVLCGYQAPNTLGYHLHGNHPYLKSQYKQELYRVKISGHSSAESLNSYLDDVTGRKIMVHSPSDARENLKHENLVLPHSNGFSV